MILTEQRRRGHGLTAAGLSLASLSGPALSLGYPSAAMRPTSRSFFGGIARSTVSNIPLEADRQKINKGARAG